MYLCIYGKREKEKNLVLSKGRFLLFFFFQVENLNFRFFYKNYSLFLFFFFFSFLEKKKQEELYKMRLEEKVERKSGEKKGVEKEREIHSTCEY